jgi:SAM-dependent methyltransferase
VIFRELQSLPIGNSLDAGCGIGDYSIFLANRGHKVAAFDPSPFAVETLVERGGRELGVDAQVNTIEAYTASSKFDNIVSIEVIEHIEHDQDALKKAHSLLKKGGILTISAPAGPFLYGEADKVSGHYRRYAYGDFKRLLNEAGFKVLYIKRYGFPLLFLYGVLRKIFLDRILIRHFSSQDSSHGERIELLPRLYPFLLIIDQLNLPFGGIGYVAKCKK